jgi:hypothetical protein
VRLPSHHVLDRSGRSGHTSLNVTSSALFNDEHLSNLQKRTVPMRSPTLDQLGQLTTSAWVNQKVVLGGDLEQHECSYMALLVRIIPP